MEFWGWNRNGGSTRVVWLLPSLGINRSGWLYGRSKARSGSSGQSGASKCSHKSKGAERGQEQREQLRATGVHVPSVSPSAIHFNGPKGACPHDTVMASSELSSPVKGGRLSTSSAAPEGGSGGFGISTSAKSSCHSMAATNRGGKFEGPSLHVAHLHAPPSTAAVHSPSNSQGRRPQ
jgi:hypothetical protein